MVPGSPRWASSGPVSRPWRRPEPGRSAAAKPTGPGVEAAWVGWSLADRLFGRVALAKGEHSYSSRLQLSDLLLEAGEEEAVVVELRDGVGIERETRTAGNSVKYDLEVVPAGTRFRGRVRFKNPWDYEIGALAQALWMLDQGLLLLGGKSARGLGWMQVEVSPPQLRTAAEILARSVASAEPTQFGEVEQHFAPYLEKLETLRGAAAENRIAEEEAV
ncbi:MAG: RAMP superfamily CRISPR-associated protein [Thermoanaerobaculia bacterium]